ncbi:MAG: LamG domain-containing protein, partial [Acidobacteria bacterium]|nr:LamG domain-containing protein [Acidobacteriota bacterium]
MGEWGDHALRGIRIEAKGFQVYRRMSRQTVVFGSVGVFMLVTVTGALASTRALWHMDDTNGVTMSDSSGNGNDGQVTNVAVGQPPVHSGTSFGFNGGDEFNSYVTVPDNANSLDPFDADITITAWVSLTGPLFDDSYDIVRKGLGTTSGGDWKMEIKNIKNLGAVGKLKCTFRGDPGRWVTKTARPDIIDGQPHQLRCIKTATSVIAQVDGGKQFTNSTAAGTIANDALVMVGAKVPGDDEYNGLLDEVSVEIGP